MTTFLSRFFGSDFLLSPRREDAKNTKGIGRMTEDEIGRQLLTYLKLTDRKLGYLLNFGEVLMKHGITRTVNRLPEESR